MIPRPKVLYDPLTGVVDIASILPMVDAPEFQLLRGRRQLSFSDLAFPAARHSRFEHSIGAFAATRRLADRWVKQGVIDVRMRRALMGYALYHDIGHSAFSHVTEDFCGDHKARAIEIATSRRETIEKCDIDAELMLALLAHKNPLHLAVSDKNIGIEKLDYLERDGWYTGVGSPSGVKYLRKYLYFSDGHVAIDEKMVDHVIDTMNFYQRMYKLVYLRKCDVIAQRTLHKLLHYLVLCGELNPSLLPDMTDAELMGLASQTKHPGARQLYVRLRQRNLLREAVVIRSKEYARETRVVEKPIAVLSLSGERAETIIRSTRLRKENHEILEAVETRIASLLKLPLEQIVLVPAFYANRFVSTDVHIYGSDGRLSSLRERRGAAFDSMEETARAYAALRICVPNEHREATSKAAEDILAIIEAS